MTSRVRHVLSFLRSAGLKAKLSKCEFHQTSVKFLGHVISNEGIRTDPDKLVGMTSPTRASFGTCANS
jgi:hypothetical protein